MLDSDPDAGWRQLNITSTDWQHAEAIAVTHLWPWLATVQATGGVSRWWFVRKGATWRLRLRPGPAPQTAPVDELIATLAAADGVHSCALVVYEPEIHAFGGVAAMDIAHDLFHADSRHLLEHLAHARTDHRRELALILGSRLLRAAGQDFYEQGDIWTRLAAHRVPERPVEPPPALVGDVRRLITATVHTPDSPLTEATRWPAAFEHAGLALARLAQCGELTRGLRAVLTHHLIFALNRHGVAAADQHLLATAISRITFQQQFTPAPKLSSPPPSKQAATVAPVSSQPSADTTTDTAQPRDAERLRHALADYIRGWNVFKTPQVEAAFRTVPRHLFLPGVDLETAYQPRPVVTKRADDGSALSSASSPKLVATMLEQLDVRPGHRVLEIGAATGINAALLAELVGPTGSVVTIELDEDLADGARASLLRAGYDHAVQVICGDGALGHPNRAPYDRIIVTAGSWDLVHAWWQQLAPGGRLVVPLRLHGSGLTRVIAFDLADPDRLISTSAYVCGFVPLRGASETIEAHVRLGEHVVFHVEAADHADQAALTHTLTLPAHEQWTGIQTADVDPVEHLDLWLATHTKDRFGRLSVAPEAREAGLLNPALRWGGAALYDDYNLAYLALRPHRGDPAELGVIAHGPDAADLAGRLTDLLQQWQRDQATVARITAHRRAADTHEPAAADGILRPDTRLTITW
ncbi:methyltransferase, FxLD system [Actinoplanes sp. NPDC051475]|uniref:methyltransferase, FxLD system n=1 Tax=Actinoplanes sp. NPDC051475 TaxID=3157225 RepID=UPI00344D318D